MCECLNYSDGERHQCAACSMMTRDILTDAVATLSLVLMHLNPDGPIYKETVEMQKRLFFLLEDGFDSNASGTLE